MYAIQIIVRDGETNVNNKQNIKTKRGSFTSLSLESFIFTETIYILLAYCTYFPCLILVEHAI